ncbi:MAG TPA: DUF6235 family protein [Pilimelia sp.]|nr:DUF6235 family protein [Pilimelia sp.]
MSERIEPTGGVVGTPFRLGWGLHLLDEWSAAADQIQRNALYAALFAVSDGSVFTRYEIIDDPDRPLSFFVVVRKHLVVRIAFRDFDVFGIGYVGPLHEAPGPGDTFVGEVGTIRPVS